MKSRNWVRLFLSTLVVGGITTGIIGFALKWNEYLSLFFQLQVAEILSILVWLIGVGFIFSIISQAGFFAYLTVHRLGISFFKSAWNKIQVALVLFTLFDIVYLPKLLYDKESIETALLLTCSIIIGIVSIVVAYFKMKQTNKTAFVPTLFFMTVVTAIELIPVLRTNDESWLFLMLIPLLVCNIYQLFVLPKLSENNKKKAVGA